jgi:hypothetical protein
MSAERAAIQRLPVQGNPSDDRKDYPDLKSSQKSLRQCPPARSITVHAFFRHRGIYRSDEPNNLGAGAASRWSAPSPSQKRDGRNCALGSSSAMSSGRLFLDRVARQQSPSPLHRYRQNKLWTARRKPIIIER